MDAPPLLMQLTLVLELGHLLHRVIFLAEEPHSCLTLNTWSTNLRVSLRELPSSQTFTSQTGLSAFFKYKC